MHVFLTLRATVQNDSEVFKGRSVDVVQPRCVTAHHDRGSVPLCCVTFTFIITLSDLSTSITASRRCSSQIFVIIAYSKLRITP